MYLGSGAPHRVGAQAVVQHWSQVGPVHSLQLVTIRIPATNTESLFKTPKAPIKLNWNRLTRLELNPNQECSHTIQKQDKPEWSVLIEELG